jgi:hypothetical protein
VERLLVIGHSIVKHGPAAQLGWKGHWGMAATAREKDWSHVLRARLAAAQGGRRIELVTRNLLAPQLEQAAAAGRFAPLAEVGPDLVLIQVGDNMPKDKATEETLTRPYEQLLIALKRANPKAAVFGLSTWGACAHRNELMRKACARQGVGWIGISHLIGDKTNRAVSEGHFEHAGVNWHPGDRGMAAIAETVFDALQDR